eukprot:10502702-Alexandrium_andersonii.AAC.1
MQQDRLRTQGRKLGFGIHTGKGRQGVPQEACRALADRRPLVRCGRAYHRGPCAGRGGGPQ